MISRDKLFLMRAAVKRGELLDRDQQLALIDHGIQALVEMAGGQSVEEKREELRRREREVGKGLKQLRDEVNRLGAVGARALFVLDTIGTMLKASGTAWRREWAWYQPLIEEEFDE